MFSLHRLSPLVLALALVPLAAGAAPAASQPARPAGAAAGSAYAANIGAFLHSVQWYERGIKKMPEPSEAFQREYVQALLASLTPAQFYAKAAPVIARYITPEQAATLGAMARKRAVPLGKQQAALQAFWAMEKKIGPELDPVWIELGNAFSQRAETRAVAEFRRAVGELAEHRGTAYMPQVNKVGLPYLDRLLGRIVFHVREKMNASDNMERACSDAGMETALRPASVMAQDGIAKARQALDGCEHALEELEKSNERSFNELRTDLQAINLPPGSLAEMFDRQARAFYDFSLKHGELNRQLLAAHRRMVSLVEDKRATMQLEGGKMLFAAEADVAEFNRNIGEVETLAKSINDLIYQTRQKGVLRNMDLGDGITAPTEPAAGT